MAENKHNGASNENGAETVLSESNVKFLVTIMQHLLTKPDVDVSRTSPVCCVFLSEY